MVDLMPTLLGRIGLPGKEDFLQQCEGEDFLSPSFERAFALTQRTSQRITDADKGKKKYAILTNRWRYEYVEGMSGRLFDLEDELTEVTSSHPKVASDLDAHLRRVLERRFSNKAKPAEPEAEKRLLEQLEELGYGGEED
jgi:arylsulfatase A-like enzyme